MATTEDDATPLEIDRLLSKIKESLPTNQPQALSLGDIFSFLLLCYVSLLWRFV
jgi:hypothetical protein